MPDVPMKLTKGQTASRRPRRSTDSRDGATAPLSFKAQLPLRVATHPAGSVIALNGANAAMAALEDVGVATQSLASPSGAKHYRSAGAARGCCRKGRGGLLERKRRRDRDLELPGREQLGELAEPAAVGLHDHRRDLDAPLLVRWVLGDRRKVTAVAHGADRDG